ncbi:MAG: quinol monooxygenase YgiN [Patiriisocius sp.]|jgi:quinol monooxygenase YgiN
MSENDVNQAKAPLTALVEYQVRSETTSVNEWLDVWQGRGEDALAGEPETSCYEAAVSDQDTDQVLVFERYTNGRASIDAHIARPAHTTLMETMGGRKMTRRRVMSNQFVDIDDYGWWSRAIDESPMRDVDVLITLIGTRFASDEMKQRYIEVTGEHAAYCFDAEPDTLIYNGCIAQGDADRGPDIKTGDMLFVAAFKNEAAAVKHRDDPSHVALQPRLAEIERQRTFMRTYRSTGRGYLWRITG